MVLVSSGTGNALEIVLLEDSLLDARLTIESLKKCNINHRLTLFRTGGEALDFLYKRGPFSKAPQPDVVLLDLFLPDLDGVAVLREMRTDGQLRQIPVVVLTSSDDGSDKRECELLGVSSYIRKPFSEDKFLSVIKRMHGLSISNAVPH